MKINFTNLLVPLGALLVASAIVDAQAPTPMRCEAALQYVVTSDATKTATTVEAGVVSAEAATEELSKDGLKRLLLNRRSKIAELCRQEYENSANCVAKKLQAYEGTLATLSFAVRKELESAIVSDCKRRAGTCGEVSLSEVKCAAAAVEVPAAEAKKEEKAKGKKK